MRQVSFFAETGIEQSLSKLMEYAVVSLADAIEWPPSVKEERWHHFRIDRRALALPDEHALCEARIVHGFRKLLNGSVWVKVGSHTESFMRCSRWRQCGIERTIL